MHSYLIFSEQIESDATTIRSVTPQVKNGLAILDDLFGTSERFAAEMVNLAGVKI